MTPVLTPNVTTVDGMFKLLNRLSSLTLDSICIKGIFPGRGSVIWRDWYSHDIVNTTGGAPTTLAAPLGHINVHIRDGSAILLHAKPAYTVEETRQGPFSLLVSQSIDGHAFGSAYIDDGVSYPPGPNKVLTFTITKKRLVIAVHGPFNIKQRLRDVTILGVTSRPTHLLLDGRRIGGWRFLEPQGKLVVELDVNLNGPLRLEWD